MQIYRSLDEVKEAGTIAPDSIVNADCLDAMKFIPDRSIDAIICDLPYGVTACKWDVVIPFDLLWEQYKRIIKPNGAIALFGSQPFTSALVMSNPKWFKYEWIWDKAQTGNIGLAKYQPLKITENISIFSKNSHCFYPVMIKGKLRVKGGCNRQNPIATGLKKSVAYLSDSYYPKNVLYYPNCSNKNQRVHPTQKPVPLVEYLLKTYSLENEIILDNTSGSGTLAIAAINTNRRYICIEKDPDYFDVMRNRIENHDPNALATPKKTKRPRAITEGQLALFG